MGGAVSMAEVVLVLLFSAQGIEEIWGRTKQNN
jgi:hypothetical protein